MREFPTAWRGIDGDEQPAPAPGEGVLLAARGSTPRRASRNFLQVYSIHKDGVDYQQRGYPDLAFAPGRDPRERSYVRGLKLP